MSVTARVTLKADFKASPEGTRPPDHAVALPGGSWDLWRWIAVRSAGIPADDVLSLAFSECAAGADEVIQSEATRDAERDRLLLLIQTAIEEARVQCNFAIVNTLAKIRRQIKSNRLQAAIEISEIGAVPKIGAAVKSLHRASEEAIAVRAQFDRILSAAGEETSEAVRRIASAPRFREALTWQNHPLLQTCIEPLLGHKTRKLSSKHRQHEELVASYLHRYCVKNDTIGFFGPVGWARLDER